MTLDPQSRTIEMECPSCNKEIHAIRIDNNLRVFLSEDDQSETSIRLLGCPACHIVYWGKK